jgi:squalene monooxygenase
LSHERRVDVVVAGGGTAGAAVAVALSELGLGVLVVEPGIDSSKRLAGELIHPPGATDLAQLGLLRPLQETGGALVRGFAVFADAAVHLLPYARVTGLREHGFAMEHAVLAETLRAAVEKRPGVEVWYGARVVALDAGRSDSVGVTVQRDAAESRLRAGLVVGADGATSTIRKLAGITHDRQRISMMRGYLLHGATLPHPGYGTVFIGGPGPILAYQVAADAVRVMFDVPDNPLGIEAPVRDRAYLTAIPEPFRHHVSAAIAGQRGLVSANASVTAAAVVRGRVALVGDAAGCCHPLTATGLSVCTRDATRLRDALRADPGDVPRALRRYAARRGGPQRTRFALAEALYQVFVARSPEMRLLRQGLLRYWKASARGRAASMALLSTHEGRMSVMAREYAQVVAHALPGVLAWDGRRDARSLASRSRAVLALSRTTLRYATEALRGAIPS